VKAVEAIRAALHGGRRLTVAEMVAESLCSYNGLVKAIHKLPWVVCVGMVRANDGANGGGKPAKQWALIGTAPVWRPPSPDLLGPDGPGRSDVRDSDGVSDDDADGEGGPTSGHSGPSQWVRFEASAETAECPSQGVVKLADCIDGYVDATACERGTPCDGCPIGRQRRAAWAGADFEDAPDECEEVL
jgi:hypothetical protein